MSIAREKICCMCGIDVSERKRTKDTSGRYYCQECHDSALLATQVAPRPPVEPTPKASKATVPPIARPPKDSLKLVLTLGWTAIGIAAIAAMYFFIYLTPAIPRGPAPKAPSVVRDSGVPTITVENASGGSESSARFSDWQLRGIDYAVYGRVVWDGELRIDSMTYEVRQSGVRIRSGSVHVEGGYLRKNEPTAVSLSIGREPASDMSITISVQH